MIRKTIAVLFAFFAVYNGALATETFITFTPQSETLSLKDATIGYSEQEYEGVKMAIQNLREDMWHVLGTIPAESKDVPTILIGTLGKNKEIDKLKLTDLKGKREKYIITTVGQQLVIAQMLLLRNTTMLMSSKVPIPMVNLLLSFVASSSTTRLPASLLG